MLQFFRQRAERQNQAHELAIASGIRDRPDLKGCQRWRIDLINQTDEQPDGHRVYRVKVTAWWGDEQWQLCWDVQTGKVQGAIQALYWMTL